MVATSARMIDNTEIYPRLLLALGVGLLIGFERGWQAREAEAGARAAGIRTFTLIGFLGGLAGLLGEMMGDAVLAVVFAAVGLLVLAVYVMNRREGGDKGLTTDIAALITFALGVVAVRGDMVMAAAGAVVTAAFLGVKAPLHAFLQRVRRTELDAVLKLLLISVVLLPVLPDKGYGPGGVWNPYVLWWMVVLVSGVSLAGYLAMRLVGARRGTLAMGLVGGLASSTAVTVSSARMARTGPPLATHLAAAIAAATGVMMLRTLAIALVLFGAFGAYASMLAPPFVAAALGAFAAAWLLSRAAARAGSGADEATPQTRTPENIGTALEFALVLAVVILVAHYARGWLGTSGVLATGAISGLVDVDAVTVSMTRMATAPTDPLSLSAAAAAILVASVVNTLVKVGIAAAIGNRRLTLLTAGTVAASLGAGAAGYALAAAL
jgi:uncharacterized membrane protein (DUF4010 family)